MFAVVVAIGIAIDPTEVRFSSRELTQKPSPERWSDNRPTGINTLYIALVE
jgi:hypothetical protein